MNLGMNVRVDALEMEQSLYTRRLEVAKRYARENKLNNVVFENPDAWLGIMTAGKTYNDLMQAFLEMGLDDDALRRYGIRILKMGMLFPMEPTIVREFAEGLEEIFVIEEKRPFLEMFAKQVLYGRANARASSASSTRKRKSCCPTTASSNPTSSPRAAQAPVAARPASNPPKPGSSASTRSTPAPSCPPPCAPPGTAPAARTTAPPWRPTAASCRPASAATPWPCG
jgi:TPP-dependent indolepyruvate ferredoxin oxidoreductase alpha subunit